MMYDERSLKGIEKFEDFQISKFCHPRLILTVRGVIMGRGEVIWNVTHLQGYHQLQH